MNLNLEMYKTQKKTLSEGPEFLAIVLLSTFNDVGCTTCAAM